MFDCNCLCAINHPKERGICQNRFDRIVIFTVPEVLSGPIRGRRDVDMCDACATATLKYKREREQHGTQGG